MVCGIIDDEITDKRIYIITSCVSLLSYADELGGRKTLQDVQALFMTTTPKSRPMPAGKTD